jgi:hypothetical protein
MYETMGSIDRALMRCLRLVVVRDFDEWHVLSHCSMTMQASHNFFRICILRSADHTYNKVQLIWEVHFSDLCTATHANPKFDGAGDDLLFGRALGFDWNSRSFTR